MLTRILSQELAGYNISVNELIPGPVKTTIDKNLPGKDGKIFPDSEWHKDPEDVVPLLLRSVEQLSLDRAYLDEVSREDCARGLEEVDCRELAQWSPQRRHVWLRHHLRWSDELGESHPPSRAEIRRADDVVLGLVRACELLGGRRLSRHQQHLSLS